MPLSYAHTQGDGSNRNFDVPCEYLSKSHVAVRVDGVAVPFSWIDTYRVRTTTAPPPGSVVEVRRTTPRLERLVTFTDGSTLVQSDLNTSTLQSFFLSQEAFDQGAASMAVTEDGQFSAIYRRIANVANPVNDQDAVTKAWAKTDMASQLAQATAKANEAASAASSANTAKTTSEAQAQDARASATTATNKAAEVASKVADAKTYRDEAATKASDAAARALEAKGYRDTAATKAGEAASSAAAAAQYDPARFYTKSEIDVLLSKISTLPVGTVIDVYGNGSTSIPGFLKVVPGLEISPAYPQLRAFGIANGWELNGAGNPVMPNGDALFKRQWSPSQTRDAGRTFGSVQTDAMQNVTATLAGSTPNNQGNGPFLGTGAGLDSWSRGGGSGTAVSYGLSFDLSRAARTAQETRPANMTVTYYIKAYDEGAATAAQIEVAKLTDDITALASRVENSSFSSLPQIVTFGGLLTLPHGLPRKPTHISAYWTPSAAAGSFAGYTSGADEVLLNNHADHPGSGTSYGVSMWADDANIYVRMGANGIIAMLLTKTTGVYTTLPSAAQSNLIIKASL
jgi:hypothetical protein